jgi:hypothetical protein
MLKQVNDGQARRAAKRAGLYATKSRWRANSCDNLGGFMLVDPHTNGIVCGEKFNLSPEEVVEFCKDDDQAAAKPEERTIMATQAEMTAHLAMLKDEFLNTAEWRRRKAIEYPDDERNLGAVTLLERLANTVDQVEPSVLRAYVELWRDDECYGGVETVNALRGVGFQRAPKSATDFVRELTEKLTAGTISTEIPPPRSQAAVLKRDAAA